MATRGEVGDTNVIGGGEERTILGVVESICELLGERIGKSSEELRRLIRLGEDRPGHDRRYAVDSSKVTRQLGWSPRWTFEDGLLSTVRWYLEHGDR